jgi:hypothetical protein
VTIEGVISNTPLLTSAELTAIGYDAANPQIAASAHDYLDGLADSDELIEISTELRTYQNMALQSLNMPRNVKVGDAFEFTASFKEIRVVQNETVIVTTRLPNGQAQQNKGDQATTTAPAQQTSQSILYRGGTATGVLQKAKGAIQTLTGQIPGI